MLRARRPNGQRLEAVVPRPVHRLPAAGVISKYWVKLINDN